MATPLPPREYPHGKKSRSSRWIALFAASMLLHVIAFNWADGRIGLPALRDRSPPVITTELRSEAALIPPAAVAAPPKEPQPKPVASKRRAKPRRASAPPPPPPVAEAPSLPPAGMEVPGTSVEPATGIAAADMPEAGAEAVPAVPPATDDEAIAEPVATPDAEQQTVRYKINPPPSAELKYDVQALRGGQMVYGRGTISWQSNGNEYTVRGEAAVLFFTVLSFTSDGIIDDHGVAPVIYSEKRFRKSETNTHFHRERNTISFSASTAAYPRKGGEQDRASIVWQLAGIGRGDSEKFVADAEIDIFVAGVRDGEIWRIRVIGEEEVEVGAGKVAAWHVVRIPRPGSYDQKLDIWLAPQQEWYPVKLRYTETNGDFLDMSLSNLHFIAGR